MSFRTIEEELARSGRAVSYTVGTSMEPMLHERRSTVVIEPACHPLRRGDVALFRRPDDTYVLHRVVRALDGGYLMRGDNQYRAECVPAEWVLGVLAGYYADERDEYTPCGSPADLAYRRTIPYRYARLWLRAFPRRAKGKLRRLLGI